MQEYYKYKYYLNASHSFDDVEDHKHSHTFVITLYIEMEKSGFVAFYDVDKRLDSYFRYFNGMYLNDIFREDKLSPTIENLGDMFYEELGNRLARRQMHLIQLEITENPVRSYIVSDRLLMSSTQNADKDKKWKEIIETSEMVFSMKN